MKLGCMLLSVCVCVCVYISIYIYNHTHVKVESLSNIRSQTLGSQSMLFLSLAQSMFNSL